VEYRKQQFETYEAFTQQFSCDYSQPLARGGHGEIYRGVDLETNEEVAIKRRLYSPDSDLITLEKEFTHTQALPPNRFVVRYVYYGRYATPFGTFEFLVMKFYRDGNLTHNALPWNKLTEAQQRRFTEEFLKGLAHLHHHQVIHRDIKPENILLVKYIDADGSAYRPVIADFGISKLLSENPEAHHNMMQNSMRVGTVTYMAPEQLRAQNLSFNADLWAFGIIMYEIITGKYMIPRRSFPDLQREEAYTFWRNADEQRFPADMDSIPEPYQQIIRRCLLADPQERVQSTDELLTLLSLQPQLAEVEKHLKKGRTVQAIEVLEAIEQRAALPSVAQKLNELRLNEALDAPPVVVAPIADRPVEFDEEAPLFVSVEPVLPMTPPAPPAQDDYQRTQQFTEQFNPNDPVWHKPVSPLAAFHTPEPPPPPTRSEPKSKAKPNGIKPAPVVEAPVAAVVDVPTPDKPFEEAVANVPEQPNTPVAVQTEVFDEVPASNLPAAEPEPVLPAYTETYAATDTAYANVPDNDDVALAEPPPASPLPPVARPVVATPRQPLPIREWVDDCVSLGQEGFHQLRTNRKARMIAFGGVGLLFALVLLFSSGSPEPVQAGQQTSPKVSEDYRKALALFKEYQVRYEKTGELNPYLWAFIHCNPDYDDSLVNSAKLRSVATSEYIRSLFPEHEPNLTGYKKQEVRSMLISKIAWEKMPHDPNCAPGQLLENEKVNDER
jgi:serine/threonine protein kinase